MATSRNRNVKSNVTCIKVDGIWTININGIKSSSKNLSVLLRLIELADELSLIQEKKKVLLIDNLLPKKAPSSKKK